MGTKMQVRKNGSYGGMVVPSLSPVPRSYATKKIVMRDLVVVYCCLSVHKSMSFLIKIYRKK